MSLNRSVICVCLFFVLCLVCVISPAVTKSYLSFFGSHLLSSNVLCRISSTSLSNIIVVLQYCEFIKSQNCNCNLSFTADEFSPCGPRLLGKKQSFRMYCVFFVLKVQKVQRNQSLQLMQQESTRQLEFFH